MHLVYESKSYNRALKATPTRIELLDFALELTQAMSQASTTLDGAIQDADILFEHFDTANTHPPPENTEVLKRAGLVMGVIYRAETTRVLVDVTAHNYRSK